MNGYVAFYKGKRIEVYADTSLNARDKAAAIFKARKAYEVTVILAEKNGGTTNMIDQIATLKAYMKIHNDPGDPHGTCMTAFFDVVGEMYWRGLDIPAEWGYRPSPISNDPRDEDSFFYQACVETSDEGLLYYGKLLHRWSERIRAQGRDY